MAYRRDSPRLQGIWGQWNHLCCLHPGHPGMRADVSPLRRKRCHPHPPGVAHYFHRSYQGPDHQHGLAQAMCTCRAPGRPAELCGYVAVDGRFAAVLDQLVRPKVVWRHFPLPQCFGRAAHGQHQPQHRHRSPHHVGMGREQHLWLSQCPGIVRPSTEDRVRQTAGVPRHSEQLGESHCTTV